MSNSSEHAGQQNRTDDTDTESASGDTTKGRSLLPRPRESDESPPSLPEKYTDDSSTESVGGRVPTGNKAFIEDLVEVHPHFESTNSLINAWIAELRDEHAEYVAERLNQIEDARGEF